MTFTIHQKLVAVIAVLTVALVAFLTVFFRSQEIDNVEARLADKGETYSALVAAQLATIERAHSASADEMVAPIASDNDFRGVSVFDERGELVHQLGDPPPWTDVRRSAGRHIHVVRRGDGILVTAPVVEASGKRGTIALQLSREHVREVERQITRTALKVGTCALFFGMLMAWAIARSLARRIRAVSNAAIEVAAGNLDVTPPVDRSRDEIGEMARAFAAMLLRIQGEHDRLERMVGRRTRALDKRAGDLRLLLDHMEQGFFTVDRDGRISPERSAVVESWLGPVPPSGSLIDYVAAFDPEGAAWFEVGWNTIRLDLLPLDLALAQLPTRFVVGERTLGVAYKPIQASDGALRRILVIITDMTATVARERAERDMRETTSLVSHLLTDRATCLEFHDEAAVLISEIGVVGADAVMTTRRAHTLKGNAATFGLASIADLCHEIETEIANEGTPSAEQLRALDERWRFLSSKLQTLLAGGQGHVMLEEREYRELVAAVERGDSPASLRHMLDELRYESARVRLERFADQVRTLAERLQKGPIEVRVECDPVRLPREKWAPFWSVFGHAVRNAVDHGVQGPDGEIVLRAKRDGERIAVEIQDHGRGIDWDRLADAARMRGQPARTRDDLVEALFADGVTTRDEVTEVSGRGVGMGIVRETCRAMGGDVRVWSEPGRGTRLRFELPRA